MPSHVTPDIPRSWWRRHWHQLLPLMVFALLRAPTLWSGLPYVGHPDEPINYWRFHTMVVNHDWLPRTYDYPSLQFDVQALVHWLVGEAGRAAGIWHSWADVDLAAGRNLGTVLALSSGMFVVHRLVTLVVSCVGVAVAAALAARLSGSQRWGAVGGFLMAVSGIWASSGAVITPDAMAGTAALLVLWYLVDLVDGEGPLPGMRWALVTGAWIGLAVGSKYNDGFLVLALAAAVMLTSADRRPSLRRLLALSATAIGVFLLTTPAAVLTPVDFGRGVSDLLGHYAGGHVGAEGGFGTTLGFLWTSDAVVLVLGLAGGLLARGHGRARLLLATWVVVYVAVCGSSPVQFDRNLTPAIGAVAVLGAVGAAGLWRSLATSPRVMPAVVCAGAAAIALVPGAIVQGRDGARQFAASVDDHLTDAREWLTALVPRGTRVTADAYAPWLDRTTWSVHSARFGAIAPPGEVARADVIVMTSRGSGLYLDRPSRDPVLAAEAAAEIATACEAHEWTDGRGFWIRVLFRHCPPRSPGG